MPKTLGVGHHVSVTTFEVAPLVERDPRKIGDYVVRGRLGEGGMGTVYLADDPNYGPDLHVAIKVIRADVAAQPEFIRRFEREVGATRAVQSQHVAVFLDAGVDNAMPWLAIRYHAGRTLKDWVDTHGPLDAEQVEALAMGLLIGLGDIHRAGLIHRDVKPSNVLLTSTGPVIIDFGLAVGPEATSITRTGHVVGSPGWMAPEQVSGGRIGPEVDVFSWASVVQFAATGASPFGRGRPDAQLYRVLHAEPVAHGITGRLGQLVESGLAKDPAQRPSIDRLSLALESDIIARDTPSTNAAPLTRLDLPVAVALPPREQRKLPLLQAALAVLALAIAVPFVLIALRGGDPVSEANEPTVESANETRTEVSIESQGASNGSEDVVSPSAVASDSADPTPPECRSGYGSPTSPLVRTVPENAAQELVGQVWPGASLAVPFDESPRDVVTLGDGRIAMVTFENEVIVWDPAAPLAAMQRWPRLDATTWVLAPVGASEVAVGLDDGRVMVFDANQPDADAMTFQAHDQRIIGLVGLCDGRVVATGRSSDELAVLAPDGSVDRWQGSGEMSAVLRLQENTLVVAVMQGQLQIYDLDVRDRVVETISTGLRAGIVALEVLDDETLVAVDTNGDGEAWRRGADAEMASRRLGPDDWFGATMVAIPGGRVAVGGTEGSAQLWHPSTDRLVELDAGRRDDGRPIVLGDENREITATPDGHVVTVSFDDIMRIWPAGLDVDDTPVVVAPAAVVSIDPDQINGGHQLAVLGDGSIAAVARAVRVIEVQPAIASSANRLAAIVSVASADSRIAVARADGRVSLLDDNELVFDLPGDGRVVTALELTTAGAAFATVSSAGERASTVTRVDDQGTQQEMSLETGIATIHTLVGSNGLAVGTDDGRVLILGGDGSEVVVFDQADTAVVDIAQLDDGRLVVAADDSEFWLVDRSSGEVIAYAHPFGSPAPLLVWDGKVVTAGGNGRLRMWDPQDLGGEPELIETAPGQIVDVTLVGEMMVVANERGRISVVERSGEVIATREMSHQLLDLGASGERIVVASESGVSLIEIEVGS